MPSGPEITAAAKVLNQDHEGLTSRDVAKLVLEAAEEARQKSAKFAAVGQINLPGGELNHFVIGPFSTELQARKAGEGMAWDSKSGTGRGRFMVVQIVNKASEAWDIIRLGHREMAEPFPEVTYEGLYKASYWENRSKW